MNNMEMRKAFEQMLENIDVRMFLKASPLESGERSKLDKVLSEEMYYDSLYAHSLKAEQLIENIKEKIVSEDTHNFILSGYKGCGKSTFVRYFLRKMDARSLVINFDDYWEPREGIYHNIVMFLYGKILEDFFPSNGEKPCIISERYIELFHDTMNGEFLERHVDLHNFFVYFAHKLSHTRWIWVEKKCSKEQMKKELREHIQKHIKSGSLSDIMMLLVFWDVAECTIRKEKTQCFIVFENLDVIHNTEDVPELVKNILAFRNNIDKISESIYYNGKRVCDPSQDYVLMLVMRETTKAEFTNSIDHFSDGKIRFQYFMQLSTVYDLYDIISIRYRYLEGIKEKFSNNLKFDKMLSTIGNIKIVLSNPGTRKRIFSIFNNDYRTCIEALEKFGFSDAKIIESCNRFMDMPENENWPLFGCRSVIFRQIFNSFVNDVYVTRVRKYEYSIAENGKIGSINLDRMILLYLNNSQNVIQQEEFAEREYVPLNILYLEILKFCRNPETIVEAVWNMYDLQNTEMWNHLVTFDDMKIITISELRSEMDAVIQKKEPFNFARIKITLAGQAYLNYILPHFEYYASRSEGGKEYSLFSSTAEKLCNIRKIEMTIRNERKEVSDCCKHLYLFFQDVFDKLDEFKNRNFLETKFASVKASENKKTISRMFHCEKIIYSNVGYLDSFRFFIFYILDEVELVGGFARDVEITDIVNKINGFANVYKNSFPKEFLHQENKKIIVRQNQISCVELQSYNGDTQEFNVPLNIIIKMIKVCYNKSIIDSIIELMRMFGFYKGKQCAKYSNGTPNIYLAFDACIKQIVSAKYEDFRTPIAYEVGERIMAEEKRKIRKERQENRERKNKGDYKARERYDF